MRLVITAFLILASSTVWAQEPAPSPRTISIPTENPAPKKGTSTDLFEQDEEYKAEKEDDKLKNLTAKVKVVREESDGVEVFFDGDKNSGAFFLHRAIPHYAKILKDLEKSKKPQGPNVRITYTEDKKIKSVELKTDEGKAIPKDPNEKWNLDL